MGGISALQLSDGAEGVEQFSGFGRAGMARERRPQFLDGKGVHAGVSIARPVRPLRPLRPVEVTTKSFVLIRRGQLYPLHGLGRIEPESVTRSSLGNGCEG